jgi:single-strand DNA-binding protein
MAGETIITIEGNLTNDPELRFAPSGSAVSNFTVASTPRTYDAQSKQWKDGETLFMRCAAWRELGENVAETLAKGMGVIVTGRLKSRSYETKEGEKRTVIELEADNVGPSLKWAIAKVKRIQRANGQGGGNQQGGNQQGGGFGGGQQGGQQASQQGGQQGGGWGGQQQVAQDDPWATPGVSNAGGWGNGPDSEPPF